MVFANVSIDSKDQPFSFDTETVLRNGKVLGIAHCKNVAAIFDPTLRVWTKAALPTTSRVQFTSTLLNNGKVLVSGGNDCSNNRSEKTIKTVEMYDPTANKWTVQAPLNHERSSTLSYLLKDGKVLVMVGSSDYGNVINFSIELGKAGSE
jgi:N-acetylneuraminic acid mutarotase